MTAEPINHFRQILVACVVVLVPVSVFVLFNVAMSSMSSPLSAQDLAAQKAALKAIQETADSICYTVQQQGQQNDKEVSGQVDAKLNGLAAKFADIGMKGSGEAKNQEFQGVFREQLASALKYSADCKKEVFKTLVDRMLPLSTGGKVSEISAEISVMQKNDQRKVESQRLPATEVKKATKPTRSEARRIA